MRQSELRGQSNWSKLSPSFRWHVQRRAWRHTDDITAAVSDAADRITAARVMLRLRREGRDMSLLGKMAHLTESAQDFTRETEAVLDGIAEKIKVAKQKRDIAKDRHHGYYDAIITGVDESVQVIDRLSNSPLPENGDKS